MENVYIFLLAVFFLCLSYILGKNRAKLTISWYVRHLDIIPKKGRRKLTAKFEMMQPDTEPKKYPELRLVK